MRDSSGIRQILAVVTALVTILPGPLLTLAEARDGYDRVTIEAEHDPARCSPVHHHLACIQHAGSASHPMVVRLQSAPTPVRPRRLTLAARTPAGPAPLFLSLPRAPPSRG